MNCPLSGKPCDKSKLFNITNITGSDVQSYSVCEECLSNPNPNKKPPSVILQAMMSLLGFGPVPEQEKEEVRCTCGLSLKELTKTGKLGCPQCYETFGEALNPVLQKTQYAMKHTGKTPKPKLVQRVLWNVHLVQVNEVMQYCIEVEDYEQAAACRDKIKALTILIERHQEATKDDDAERASLVAGEIDRFIQLSLGKST